GSQSLLRRARAGVGAAGTAVALLTEALLACVWPRPASLGAVVTCPAGAARRNLARLGVALGLTQAEVDADLVPDHFGVVARRDGEHLPRPDLGLRAIIHDDPHPSRNRVAQVGNLAGVGLGDRFDVRRPAPARLED